MPPADDAVLDAADHQVSRASRRSPHAVRAVLLGAFASALVGLSLGGANPTLSASSTSGPSLVALTELAVPHTPVFAPPARVATRAARSRPVVKKVAPKKKVVEAPEWARPSYAGVISVFGPRWGRQHKGIDFGDRYGSPIHSVGDGVVIGAGYLAEESGYGNITLIRHSNGYISAYAHQSRMIVHAGERVKAGETIGYVGSTGHVTGPHLHFEIRTSTHGGQVNPLSWLREHGVRI